MRRAVFSALLACVTPCVAQLPFAFPGIPQQHDLFTSLLDEPHVLEVRRISGGGTTSFTIEFTNQTGGTTTSTQNSSQESPESRFVAKLQAGKSYRMPHSVREILGAQGVTELARRLRGKPLSELRGLRPFCATVLDQGIGESTYSIVMQESGGRVWHLKGLMEDKDTRQIAAFLQGGRRFEFPAALDDALLTPEKRAERAKPSNTATAVLWRYLGEWRGTLESNPKAKVDMICHARPDGSGIWREITFHSGEDELTPLPDISIVEFDRSAGTYLAGGMAENSPPPLVSSWDEKTRTFTTVLPADDRGLKRVNTATFTRDDRIDWKTTTMSQKGQALASSGGHYERIHGPGSEPKQPPEPTRITDGAINIPLPPLPEFPKIDFSELGTSPPFRARVISPQVTPDSISVTFAVANGHQMKMNYSGKGVGKSPMAKILAKLKEDTSYEFPHCLHHPDEKPADGPTTPAMKELAPFVGEWRVRVRDNQGTLQDTPSRKRYFWSADGKFLWREYIHPNSTLLEYIRHDTDSGQYVFAGELFETDVKKNHARWDAATRTYTTEYLIGTGSPGVVRAESVRTFKSDDLIEWRSKQMNADGTVVNESSGTYERIKP